MASFNVKTLPCRRKEANSLQTDFLSEGSYRPKQKASLTASSEKESGNSQYLAIERIELK